jgi:hypothetical protein
MGYTIRATVNYPETEADTPDSECANIHQVHTWLTKLIITEPDATSFVIVLVKGVKKPE